jgi:hypothetical protein
LHRYATLSHDKAKLSSSVGINLHPLYAITNEDGYFELPLLRSQDYIINIRELALREKIRTPNLEEAELFGLMGGTVVGDPTPADTGETNW